MIAQVHAGLGLVVLAIFAAGAGGASAVQTPPLRVLFIGNSLTYANDLPAMVEALADARGVRMTRGVVAFPDFSLEDHWMRGDAVRAIEQGDWSTVVLQQGPSALPESQRLLREFTKRFDAVIRRGGAKTALHMVWPSNGRQQDFDGVHASYAAAAADVDGVMLPVGDAWRAACRANPRAALYGPDGFHPTPEATYLGALVIYATLTRSSPVGLPSTLTRLTVAPHLARLFQDAAAEVSRTGGRPTAISRLALTR